MISTKFIISNVREVPSPWVFEYYLRDRLERKLTGQREMIKSAFNEKDTRPSMCLYVKNRQYRFMDFSTGLKGDKITLVMQLGQLGFADACDKIVEDYNQFVLDHNGDALSNFKEHAKYQLKDWSRRKWTVSDKNYWTEYEVGSNHLEGKQAFPLSYYTLDNGEKQVTIRGHMIYGYFTAAGEIYKIYQPMAKERRFLKIKQHIQGIDQLTGKYQRLIIGKALKDIIVQDNLQLEAESIAPDSENTTLREHVISDLKTRYKEIITLFDNDEAGIRAMKQYEERYQIPYIVSPLEKDPSDSVKKLGSQVVRPVLLDLINKLYE